MINWNQTKKLSDEISVLSVENEKIVKLKEKLENDVGLLNEAIDIQKDQTRRYSVKLERFESKELPESEEISDLKQKIENLTEENRQLNEKISNFDSSAMSIASEQSSILEVESEEAKLRFEKFLEPKTLFKTN